MRFNLCLVAFAATAAIAAPAAAQVVPPSPPTATATANATVQGTVLLPLTLTKSSDLDFGTVIADVASPGDVTISADDGSRTITGSVIGVPAALGNRALFKGAGSVNQAVLLTLKAPATLTSGPNSLTVTSMDFDTGAASSANATTGYMESMRSLDNNGYFEVGVGGVFHIKANQPNGVYTGAFTVTADYQ